MRKCPFCGKESKLDYFCDYCDSYMGSKFPGGPPPKASEKAEKIMLEKSSAKPVRRRSPKTVEYVRLYHGPLVKKSTARWLAKKDQDALIFAVGWIILIMICSLINR